jgi:hypothetical protein
MGSLESRLERLEEGRRPDRSQEPPWVFEDRIDAVISKLRVHQSGSAPETTCGYPYTDFEITALGVVACGDQGGGEPGRIEPEDLPGHMRPYVVRMPADKQLEHEWAWYEHWRTRHERETYEELHARFQVSRLRGNIEHLAMLEGYGILWGGSPEAHDAFEQRMLSEIEEWTAAASTHEAARLALRRS